MSETGTYNQGCSGEGWKIFNVGFTEVLLILLIAFLIVGPRDLPKVARWLGRRVRGLRLMWREIKKESGWEDLEKEFRDIESEFKETEKDLQKDINTIKKDIDITPDLKSAEAEINSSVQDVHKEINKAKEETATNYRK